MPIAEPKLMHLQDLGLAAAPVAVAFLSDPPPGLARVDRAAAAGCGYWKEAADGRSFYTTPDDHLHCPVGAFTHGVALSPEKGQELQSLVGTMIELKYLKAEEVPLLPHRQEQMRFAAYAPLARATFAPDVVMFRGNARQIMLLWEAAHAAGVPDDGVMGRPACSMIPQTLNAQHGVASVGCIGNRVYTDLGDDEMYLTVPGSKLEPMLDQLGVILHANRELETFHRGRRAAIA